MGQRFIKIFSFLFFLQAFTAQSVLFSQEPGKGQITDTVRCIEQKGQNYSLYLPEMYDSKKLWPVILIFDPSARGRTAVEIFREAGRKYGFIIACSNNSRNGPYGSNLAAASAMIKDIEYRFTIDRKRIYAAGFSGGSRFAMALASSQKIITGVIGCGAGLPNDQSMYPTAASEFLYYGLAGTRDMNYIEMHELGTFLDNQTKVTSYIRLFPGGHQWPEPALITEAVEWLILQSMNRKIIPPDQPFIDAIQNKTQKLINSQLAAGNRPDAKMYMRFAARDFQGTTFAARMSKLFSDSEKSAEFRNAVRDWDRMAADEQERKEKYMSYLTEVVYSVAIPDSSFSWWDSEIARLKRIRDKGNSMNSQMASRVLNFVSVLCSEQGTALFKKRFYSQSVFLFRICTLSDSENPANYYNLARSLAASEKANESIDALSAAISHGLNSWKTLEEEPAFAKIRDNARFRALKAKMK